VGVNIRKWGAKRPTPHSSRHSIPINIERKDSVFQLIRASSAALSGCELLPWYQFCLFIDEGSKRLNRTAVEI
jgi:hypothetical protein